MNDNPGRSRRLKLVQTKSSKPGRRRLKKMFFILIIILGLGLLLFKGFTTFCRVKKIIVTVTGAGRLSESNIIDCCGVKKGTSLLLIRPRRIEQRLAAIPEIYSSTAVRKFPNHLLIKVQEREPAASLLAQGGFWLLDQEGIVFAEQVRPAENLPVITGAAAKEIVAGEPLGHKEKHAALLAFLKALSEYPLLEVAELNLSAPADLVLFTVDGRKILLGNSARMVEKLALLWEFTPYLPDCESGSCLDLRSGDRLVVVAE